MSIFERLCGYLLIGIITGSIVSTLIVVGWILFKTVFPMIGQWIYDLNYKMRMDGQRYRGWIAKRKVEKEQRKIDDSLSHPHRRFYR